MSTGSKGDIPNTKVLVEVLQDAINQLKIQFTPARTLLVGHSLGVLNTIVVLASYPTLVDHAMLAAGGLELKQPLKTSILQKLLLVIGSIFFPGKAFIPIESQHQDPVEELEQLRNYKYSIRFLKHMRHFSNMAPFLNSNFPPILVVIGDNDHLFTVDGAIQLEQQINAKEKQLLVIKGGDHYNLLEHGANQILDWLRDQQYLL